MPRFGVVILAAGKGKRTGLPYPKVMHPLCGKPMLLWVVDALRALEPEEMVVVVPPAQREALEAGLGPGVRLVTQEEPLGTGHALSTALPNLRARTGTVLVACGDTPLLSTEIFQKLLEEHARKKGAATLLTAVLPDPTGYGRIVRGRNQQVSRIVEEKDASPSARKIREVNSGTYCFRLERIAEALPALTRENVQKEYYLTDCVAWLARRRQKIVAMTVDEWREALGINTLAELAEARGLLNRRLTERWMAEGVIFPDPLHVYLDENVVIGPGTTVHPFTFLEAGTRIGSGCVIGPFARIRASGLGHEVTVHNSVLMEAFVGDRCSIGPFAYLRPGTRLDHDVKVGDFVEIKNSSIGSHSKVPHLSYLGDATIGMDVNIGAGVITCNYDGKRKHHTIVEDGAFIGSNTNLRAPVRIGKNAVTGAGSVVTQDVEAGAVVAGVPARILKKREEAHGG